MKRTMGCVCLSNLHLKLKIWKKDSNMAEKYFSLSVLATPAAISGLSKAWGIGTSRTIEKLGKL